MFDLTIETKDGKRRAQAIAQGDTTDVEQFIAQCSGADADSWARAMIPKVQAILHGERNPALADDLNLHYDDAVELQLFLEALGAK